MNNYLKYCILLSEKIGYRHFNY